MKLFRERVNTSFNDDEFVLLIHFTRSHSLNSSFRLASLFSTHSASLKHYSCRSEGSYALEKRTDGVRYSKKRKRVGKIPYSLHLTRYKFEFTYLEVFPSETEEKSSTSLQVFHLLRLETQIKNIRNIRIKFKFLISWALGSKKKARRPRPLQSMVFMQTLQKHPSHTNLQQDENCLSSSRNHFKCS